jgi:hypothetical protein
MLQRLKEFRSKLNKLNIFFQKYYYIKSIENRKWIPNLYSKLILILYFEQYQSYTKSLKKLAHVNFLSDVHFFGDKI